MSLQAPPKKIRLVTYAWGSHHICDLLNYTLASVLAPGNLPVLSRVFECEVVVVTEEAFFSDIRNSSMGCALQDLCRLKLVSLDDLISEPWQYGMTISQSLFRGIEDLGPAMTDTYLLFLNADFVLSDGSYERLIDRIHKGERAILAPSYCVVEERVRPILDAQRADQVLAIPGRELAKIVIQNRHNTIRAKTVNQALIESEYTDQFYWLADENTLISHQLPISLIALRPERHVPSVSTFWDWGIVYEFCPSQRLSVMADSDEFLMLELRPEMRSIESILLGRTAPKSIAERTRSYITQYQLDSAKFQLLLHSNDLQPDLHGAQQNLQKYVNAVLSKLPGRSIKHANHIQWRYHRKHFRARVERRCQLNLTRQRKGDHPAPAARLDHPIVEQSSLAKRVAEIAHPYKNPRHLLSRCIKELADGNPSVLMVCDHGSYLLKALDRLPGIQTHLTPDFAFDALSHWPKAAPEFDLCLIELASRNANLLNIVDAAMARMRSKRNRVLLLWNDRLSAELRSTMTEIMKVITLRQLEFNVEYDLSWLSALGNKYLRRAAKTAVKSRVKLSWQWLIFYLGMSLLILARLSRSVHPLPRYLTKDVSSLVVNIPVHGGTAVRPSRVYLPHSKALLSRSPPDVDLYFNPQPEFTKWIVKSGLLNEQFVVIDVGVLGGENPRWHFLREYLVVHGFDAIKEVIEELQRISWDPNWDRTYHWLAIGNENGEKEFFVDPVEPTRSSLGSSSGLERRVVPMRTLDSLMAERVIPQPNFIKVDVEGHEGGVLSGARQMLGAAGVLGMELETNFAASPAYPKSHFNAIHDLALENGLKLFDLNFDRVVRPTYEAARQSWPSGASTAGAGTPATFNVLFCRDIVAERDGGSFYERSLPPPTVDQIIKMMIIYELHGLSDVAVDTAVSFSKLLKKRFDVDDALERLCK